MDKILVEIYVPAAGECFDVFIPRASRIHEVLALVSGAVNDLTRGYYQAGPDAVLCDRETGAMLNINVPVAESGLCNGSKLVLV